MMGYLFVSMIVLMLGECFWQRRDLSMNIGSRWTTNLLLAGINLLLIKYLAPLLAIGAAALAVFWNLGLLNQLALPDWSMFALSFLVIDLIVYLEHRILHAVPLLWRLHLVHHSDSDVDVTTFVRHHPFEQIVVAFIAAVSTFVLGLSPGALIAFSVVQVILGSIQHANIRFPSRLDRVMRLAVVTPDMHRIHHSSWQTETDSNFGTIFSFWDRLFGSYIEAPRCGRENIDFGIGAFKIPRAQWVDEVLLQPFHWSGREQTAIKERLPGKRVIE